MDADLKARYQISGLDGRFEVWRAELKLEGLISSVEGYYEAWEGYS